MTTLSKLAFELDLHKSTSVQAPLTSNNGRLTQRRLEE